MNRVADVKLTENVFDEIIRNIILMDFMFAESIEIAEKNTGKFDRDVAICETDFCCPFV